MSDWKAGDEHGAVQDVPALLKDYLGKDELARQFGVTERTIERWVRLRLLPAPVRLGRTTLHHVPSIRAYLAKAGERNGRR